MSKFKLNDRVRVTIAPYRGKSGRVLGVYAEAITIQDDVDADQPPHQSSWSPSFLELDESQASPPEPAPSPVEPPRLPGIKLDQAAIDAYSNTYAGINRQQAAANAMSAYQVRQDQVGAWVVNDVAVKTLKEDNARLRKELEAAQAEVKSLAHAAYDRTPLFQAKQCDHEATISKLKAQHEQTIVACQKLEMAFADRGAKVYGLQERLREADLLNGTLTRELERAKRGQR